MNFDFNRVLGMFKFWDKEDATEYNDQLQNSAESIATPKKDDGAIEIETVDTGYSSLNQQFYSQDTQIKTTNDLINTYRQLYSYPEVENAVMQIVNTAIVYEQGEQVVSIDLDDTKFSDSVKTKILAEFDNVGKLLNSSRVLDTLFRRWYVDSRLFFHKIVDPNNPSAGIIELRRLDPRNVRFYREIVKEQKDGVDVVKGYREFFVYKNADSYNFNGITHAANSEIRIPRSAVVYAHSGLMDCSDRSIIGYLHGAVKPANQLKLLEDATVIYRITRAPERRVFYIDVGNMNNRKATEYVNGVMQGLKNRVVYDSNTGTIKNQKRNLSMTEDYWLMRRDGKSVTEVSTLPGAPTMGDMDDIYWFNRKLYQALHIPPSRIPSDDSNGGVTFDQGSSITRDEIEFNKFVESLQHKFEEIFLDPLRSNLILKNIITAKDWEDEFNNIKVNFHQDSYYSELMEADVMSRRMSMLTEIEPFIGKYFSHDYVQKTILKMTEEQTKQEAKLIEEEKQDPRFVNVDEEI